MLVCPSGYGTAPNCQWPHKLCATCYTNSTSGKVFIRIQSNGLPNYCTNTTKAGGGPTELTLDY